PPDPITTSPPTSTPSPYTTLFRSTLAKEFGATDIVSERGDEAVERVRELTDGFGAQSVLECVGHEQSTVTALSIARPGGAVGRRSEEHTSELQSRENIVCRLLLEK